MYTILLISTLVLLIGIVIFSMLPSKTTSSTPTVPITVGAGPATAEPLLAFTTTESRPTTLVNTEPEPSKNLLDTALGGSESPAGDGNGEDEIEDGGEYDEIEDDDEEESDNRQEENEENEEKEDDEIIVKDPATPTPTPKKEELSSKNWHLWAPGKKFPDIPGAYNGHKINREQVKEINRILSTFNKWYKYAKPPTKITTEYKKKFSSNIVLMAKKRSCTTNKPWRYHFVLYYKTIVSYLQKVGFDSIFHPSEQVLVRDWLLNLTYAQLKSPRTRILVNSKSFWNNVSLQAISSATDLAILIKSDKLLETCSGLLKKQLTNGYIKEGEFQYMSKSDLSRGDRSIGYTYSSLSWIIKIYKALNKPQYAKLGILSYRNILNNILAFYNTDVGNGAIKYSRKTGHAQSIIKGKLPLV